MCASEAVTVSMAKTSLKMDFLNYLIYIGLTILSQYKNAFQ